ncbi:von Willebrand factor D and EGF domain-containing protein [Hippocampus zosterae]|uniref:von Willebrand factor D and EGF domain-containing protein n=1 Tax=Hippocampus zosterae TaxID=109293 RepID=UPI00223DFEB5|nr:von Willebrand factor D and EGF domain-containing protein [Hippocampus zosterae]
MCGVTRRAESAEGFTSTGTRVRRTMSVGVGTFVKLVAVVAFVLPNLVQAQTALPPECAPGGHEVLQNPYRSTTFSSNWLLQSSLRDFVCDHSLVPGWYQFQIFNKPASMPTQCVEVNHCGTQAPVWLSLGEGESLPGPLELRHLTACVTWQLFPSSSKQCCLFRIPVSVRNCGEFYVYLLQPTQGCMGYCAQVMLPAAPSKLLITPEWNSGGVHLKCSFSSNSNNSSSSLGHVVAWSRASPQGKREELKRETTIQTWALIELDGFNLRLGDKIHCSVYSFFLDSPDVHGVSVESQEFFAGIRLRPEMSVLSEDGKLYELMIESTVPVPCLQESPSSSSSSSSQSRRCSISLMLGTNSHDETVLGTDVSLSSCSVDLTGTPCQDGVCGRAVVYYTAVTDFVRDGDRTTNISVRPLVTSNFVWNGYAPEPVQIKVQDIPSAYCYSFTDPHVVTFDGRRYDNYQVGTFELYRSARWPIEVHVRQWECGGDGRAPTSCACGVAARDGDDVVILDMCDGNLGQTKPRLSVKKRELRKSAVRIHEAYQRRKITLTFSSGAMVRADVADWGLSLTLRAPGSDRGHTEGLCGSYDGRPNNDFLSSAATTMEDIQAFIFHWRLRAGSSLFDTVPPPSSSPVQNSGKFCDCQSFGLIGGAPSTGSPDETCSLHGNLRFPAIIPSLDITAEYIGSVELLAGEEQPAQPSRAPLSERWGRDTHQFIPTPLHQSLNKSDLESFAYFFPKDHEPDTRVDIDLTWPTPSGLTENEAQAECWEAVANSSLALGCFGLLGVDVVGSAVEMCVSDLRLKDERSWLHAVLPLLENECERRLVEEGLGGLPHRDLWDRLDHRDAVSVLKCPDLCNGNGQCSEWGCVCFPGFGAYDCSISSEHTPEITDLESGGLCNIRDDDCSNIRVSGVGFKDGHQLKCEFVQEKLVGGKWVAAEPHFVAATFMGVMAVECRLPLEVTRATAGVDASGALTKRPFLARWQVKVSNDGYSFSNAKVITIYDGACHLCGLQADPFCTLREKMCSIDGVCYDGGQSHPFNPCLACQPNVSQHAWTARHENEPPTLSSLPSLLWYFQGEEFIYQLQARDPEGSPVVFALRSGPEGVSLSPTGLIQWKATPQQTRTYSFDFTVSDNCHAETSASLHVSVRPCECANGGLCIKDVSAPAGSGEYTCACPSGFKGQRCEVDVDDCKPNPCRLGRCLDGPDSFTCICPPGMTGRTCREDVDECVSSPCYPGLDCINTLGSFSCGLCPRGYAGDGITCIRQASDAAEQIPISRLNSGREMMRTTFSSFSSSPTLPRRSPDRSKRPGATVANPGRASSSSLERSPRPCPYGYAADGVTCKAVCRFQCGRNMECTQPNTCTCKEGYTGYNCHMAVCRPDCKNQGRCVRPNVCECPLGYAGPTCEEASCEPPCQHGGTCLARNLCTCSYGYVGPRCQILVCNRHCENGGECVSPDVCECKPGWNGPTCNSAECNPVCLNGGTCIKPNVCTCPAGFYGLQCQIAVCSPPCKNGGQCRRNNVCSCPEGYTGKRCQKSVCEPTCMNKGKCVGANTCSCTSGWRGNRCNIPVCLQKCKNGGECVGPNTCHCPTGWEGLHCQTPVCRQRCLNGGRCVLPDYCHCRRGYKGLTCAIQVSQA